MNNYYFKLVCVDEQNPLGYQVLEDVNLESLNDVHNYVEEHMLNHAPESIKWMLIPLPKDKVSVM